MRRKMTLAQSLFAVLSLSAFCAGCTSDRTKIAETKQRGDRIIKALDQFHADNGQYPKTLAELSPKYLQDIPAPTWGLKKWRYETSGLEFTLQVNESTRTGDGDSMWLRYRPKDKWQMGD